MNIKFLVVSTLISYTMSSCSQTLGPGYDFDLFKNTPNWELTKAVRNEDTNTIAEILKQSVDINFQETKYGNTVLLLAISNGKVLSVESLLNHGASLTVKDSDHFAAIHVATDLIDIRKNVPEILEILLRHGADPNMPNIATFSYDTSHLYLPLMGGIQNLACTKLLIQYGGNMYYKLNDDFPIWKQMLVLNLPNFENISVAKFLIVDQNMKIPNPIFYTIPDHIPRSIIDLLGSMNTTDNPEKNKAKEGILEYLKKIDFPKTGVFVSK